jgi:hypothetical protein
VKKPEQSQSPRNQVAKFRKAARELDCDEDPKAFERTFSKIVPPKKPKPKTKAK